MGLLDAMNPDPPDEVIAREEAKRAAQKGMENSKEQAKQAALDATQRHEENKQQGML